MRNNKTPDPNVVFPVEGFDTVTYVMSRIIMISVATN